MDIVGLRRRQPRATGATRVCFRSWLELLQLQQHRLVYELQYCFEQVEMLHEYQSLPDTLCHKF